MVKISFPFDAKAFFDKCVRDNNFPRNDFEKQAVLMELLKEFEDNKKYSEQEVNTIIKMSEFSTKCKSLVGCNSHNKKILSTKNHQLIPPVYLIGGSLEYF